MNTYSKFAMAALCAVPALVQPALAEDNVEKFGNLMGAAMDISSQFLDVLGAIKEEKATPADSAKAVEELATKLEKTLADIQATLGAMSDEEKQAVAKEMQDPEVVKVMSEADEAMKAVQAKLIELKYYDSPEFKAACEKFYTVYAQ